MTFAVKGKGPSSSKATKATGITLERTTLMKKGMMRSIFLAILLSLFFMYTGCSTTNNLYRKISKSSKSAYQKMTFQNRAVDSLRKRVLLMPFMDQAGLGEKRLAGMTATFSSLLEKDNRLILHKTETQIPTNRKIRSPEYGIIIDPDQARMAEEMGMNVLLTVIINPFEFHSVRTGIWPLRRTKKEVEVSMFVNALDITNGTLLLTHLESRQFRLHQDLMEWEEENEAELRRNIDEKDLEKALAGMVEDQAEALTRKLKTHPWAGRILSADKEKVIISAGKDVGVEPGNVFEVYDRGEAIRSGTGRAYHLLGMKVGEVKAVQVMDSYASAVPLSEETLKAGYLIRPTRD